MSCTHGKLMDPHLCPVCVQEREAVLTEVVEAAERLWGLRDSVDGKALHSAWRSLGVALAHSKGRKSIGEA